MPITQLELDTVMKACGVCATLLKDLQPALQGLQQVYDSVGGIKESLTDDDLSGVPALSGLTKQQVDDALYVLTATLLPALSSSYAPLAQLAARYRGGMAPMISTPAPGMF